MVPIGNEQIKGGTEMLLKITRVINIILYLNAIVFGCLYLIQKNSVYKILWTVFFGSASILLLGISLISLWRKKKIDKK